MIAFIFFFDDTAQNRPQREEGGEKKIQFRDPTLVICRTERINKREHTSHHPSHTPTHRRCTGRGKTTETAGKKGKIFQRKMFIFVSFAPVEAKWRRLLSCLFTFFSAPFFAEEKIIS